MFWKRGVLKNFEKLTEKHPSWSLFEIRLQVWGLQLYQKVTLTQVCSYEFCEIFTSTFFTEQLRATASEGLLLNSHFHVQPFRTALNSNFLGYVLSSRQWKLSYKWLLLRFLQEPQRRTNNWDHYCQKERMSYVTR